MSDDFTGGNLQGSNHRLRSVSHIFIGPTLRFPGTERKQRLRAIQRLNPWLSSTHSTNAFSGGFKYKPTISNNFGSNSGSGLKVNVRLRCGCNCDACRIACTVLCGRPSFRAKVLTVQRPCDSGCWQAKVCTFCQTPASCFGGRPERGASRSPSNPRSANDRRHFPTVTCGISRSEAICWFARPVAAAKTIRLRSTSACAVDGACTQLFKVALVFGSRLIAGGSRGMPQRTRTSLYYKGLSGRCTSVVSCSRRGEGSYRGLRLDLGRRVRQGTVDIDSRKL